MEKEENFNPLALDTNKWIKLVEEIENTKNANRWKIFLKEYDFDVILSDLVLKELVWLITNHKKSKSRIWIERKQYIYRLMNAGQIFNFRYVKVSKSTNYYYLKAEMLIKRYKIKRILKNKGLFKVVGGIEMYDLHKEDLAIFISLKELGRPYFFMTHDNRLLRALQTEEIRKILIGEELHFIFLHETQKAKNRKITRIKVLPDTL